MTSLRTVKITKGDRIELVIPTLGKLKNHIGKIETTVKLSYDDLVVAVTKRPTSKSQSINGRLSKAVSLTAVAIRTGRWSNRAKVDKAQVTLSLIQKFNDIKDIDIELTTTGFKHFKDIMSYWAVNDLDMYRKLDMLDIN